MSGLRFTDTNAGDDSSGRAFGLEGNLYLPIVIGLIGGVALFALLSLGLHVNFGLGAGAAALPLLAVLGWITLLKQGKPAGYDRDRLEQCAGGGDLPVGGPSCTHTVSHARAPEARFVRDLILFGAPECGSSVAKGYWVETADRRGASFERLNGFQDQVRSLLALIGPGRALQVQWSCAANAYQPPLRKYHTANRPDDPEVVRATRNERVMRYWPRTLNGGLRCEQVAVFLSIGIDTYAGNLRTRERLAQHYEPLIGELAGQFEEFAGTARAVFGNETVLRPMDDLAHFDCIHRFLNPTLAGRNDNDSGAIFDPALTVQENCWHSEGVGQPDGGFFLDGRYHAVLTLARWPQRTRPGIVTHITGLPFLDYVITVNLTPATTRAEIQREEKTAERLRGEYVGAPRASLLVALRKKERKVEQLAGGFARPFHVTYVIRVWAKTREELREKVAAVQAAIHAMDGAQYLECALSTTAKKLFFATWPGWTRSSYRHRALYAEDNYLADLLPFSATFTGDLEQAEAVYDGAHLNLVGVSTQTGGSPQHALVCGMTGSGKSEFLSDLLFQTAGVFDYTLIVDIGGSHRKFAVALGETPIVIHPDANLTLNYLDTQRLPLTQLQLTTTIALLARMVGAPDSPEALALRQAQLTAYVHQLYRDTFADWARNRPQQEAEIRRLACAVHRWRERMGDEATPLDAFVDLRDRKAANDDEAIAFVAGISEADVTRFGQDPATERFVAQTACAIYAPEEFPTHSALVELLAYARLPEHDKTEIDRLATLLRAWSANWQYGKLFDGVSNVSLHRRVALIELGLIPHHAVELKAAAGLLVSGIARQYIVSLPRKLRKRALLEEVSQLLDIPGGEQIAAEGYEQLRKHQCWVVSVVQQYARLRNSRIRSAVIGNAKQYFLLRQSDRQDMVDLAGDIGLPESAVAAIQNYPLPEQQVAEQRFSSICYFKPTAQPPQCGTLRHFQAKEARHAA